jgi:DNA repair exonuclease SbcCD ATPase subunit
MILRSLKMENFRSYQRATIQFSPNQNYFFGRNWQGKSSIMEAIGFGFFGKTVFPLRIAGAQVKIDNLVREGAKEGFVELSFDHNGKEYNILRKYPGNSVRLDSEGTTLGQSIKTVRESLYERFGLDSKLFANVFYSEQDELRRILESSPEDRKIFVEMLLGFEYLKVIKTSAKAALDELDDFIEEITSGNIKTVMDMIQDVRGQVQGKEENVKELEKQIKNESKPRDRSSNASSRMSESQLKTEQLLEKKSKVETESDYNKEVLKSVSSGRCPTCKQAISKDLGLRLVHDLRDRIQELEQKIRAVGNDLSQARKSWGAASREYESGLTLEQRLSDLETMREKDADELKELKVSLDKYEKQYKAFANKTKAIDLINKEKAFLEDFQAAVEGFRDNLRKSMTEDLENGVNHFMSQFSDNDFDAKLRINDEFGFEVILHNHASPIFNLSGAAKDILALAIRYGLYQIAARDVNFILFDEPTRHMDSTNTLKLKQAFNEMKNQQIIVITVHDEFYDAEGAKFMIEKDSSLCSTVRPLNS